MMTVDELVAAARALSKGSPDAWTGSAESMLTILSELASRGCWSEFAESYCLFVGGLPEASSMLFHCVPLMVASYHPAFRRHGAGRAFEIFDDAFPFWTAEIQDAAEDPAAFTAVLERMATNLAKGLP